jgi:hypothetical protein
VTPEAYVVSGATTSEQSNEAVVLRCFCEELAALPQCLSESGSSTQIIRTEEYDAQGDMDAGAPRHLLHLMVGGGR